MKNTTRRGFLAAQAVTMGAAARPAAAASPIKRPRSSAEVWARTELYFGTSKPGGEITDEEFAAFIDSEVTSRFPDGLTLLTGYGQFRTSDGTLVREKSHLLILFYPPQMEDANGKIQEIRECYKTRHNQESVLRGDSFTVVSF